MHESNAAPRLKILLIDDDELIAGALRSYLSGSGCDVDVATEVAFAEALMRRGQYSTVFVDPYLTSATADDRLHLIETVRRLQPAASLIVATAYATPAITESVSAGRIHKLLIKPRPVAELGRAAVAYSTRERPIE